MGEISQLFHMGKFTPIVAKKKHRLGKTREIPGIFVHFGGILLINNPGNQIWGTDFEALSTLPRHSSFSRSLGRLVQILAPILGNHQNDAEKYELPLKSWQVQPFLHLFWSYYRLFDFICWETVWVGRWWQDLVFSVRIQRCYITHLFENTGCKCHHERPLPFKGFGTPQFQETPRSIANLT